MGLTLEDGDAATSYGWLSEARQKKFSTAKWGVQLKLPLSMAEGFGLEVSDAGRAPEVMTVLAEAALDRQVIITSCHHSTAELARQLGGPVIPFGQ